MWKLFLPVRTSVKKKKITHTHKPWRFLYVWTHVGAIIPVLLVDCGQRGSCQRSTNVCVNPHEVRPWLDPCYYLTAEARNRRGKKREKKAHSHTTFSHSVHSCDAASDVGKPHFPVRPHDDTLHGKVLRSPLYVCVCVCVESTCGKETPPPPPLRLFLNE